MTMKILDRRTATLLCMFFALGTTNLFTNEIEDHFEAGSRGAKLDGSPADACGQKWIATENLQFSSYEGKGCVVYTDSEAGLAKLPVPDDAGAISVEAQVWPHRLTDGKETWLAIGLGNPSTSRRDITWSNGLFLLINTAGFFECFRKDASGHLTKVADGAVPNFRKDDFNTIRFDYAKKKNTVELFLNDEPHEKPIELDPYGTEFEPLWAGFSGGSQPPDQPSIGRFSVKVSQ